MCKEKCKYEGEIYTRHDCFESGTGNMVRRYFCNKSPNNRHPTKEELCQYCKNFNNGFERKILIKNHIQIVTPEEFNKCITNSKEDSFAKTFVSKCNMMKIWDKCFGFWVDNELCGAIVLTYSKQKPKCANLQLLHVFAKHRRKGVGRILCNESLKKSFENKCKYFRVSAEEDALSFYKSLGIKFWGKQKSGSSLCIFKIYDEKFVNGIYEYDNYIKSKVESKRKGGVVYFFGEELKIKKINQYNINNWFNKKVEK